MEKDQHELDPELEAAFVKRGNVVAQSSPVNVEPPIAEPKPKPVRRSKQAAAITPGLIPVNVRVRPEVAQALKTASLDRQMRGIEPHSKREIVEVALEPWLRSQGYLVD